MGGLSRRIVAVAAVLLGGGCGDDRPAPGADAAPPGWSAAAPLPEPLANNAVAALDGPDGCLLFTATGIDASLGQPGIHARAWSLEPGAAAWTALPDAPGEPRIAASAVALRGRVYLLGGYSVAAGGGETSHDLVAVWDPVAGWSTAAPLPVAIDDAVVAAWRDRWIVVVSGWSDTAPVRDVQIYDADTDSWALAPPFPGTPVFGHAGGIAGDTLLVVDGVASGLRGFGIVEQAWRGDLDPDQPTEITWTDLVDHPGPATYRAAGGTAGDRIVIHGGTDTPYNFDGLRYDTGEPALPLDTAFAFDPATGTFSDDLPTKQPATMDHRALVGCDELTHTIGGMTTGPAATDLVSTLRP